MRLSILLSMLFSCWAISADLKLKKGDDNIVVMAGDKAILTQVAKVDFRPYIHPIIAPDGKGELTQFSPGHHKHQTGLYWGFTRVNKRDHFHNPGNGYFKRKSLKTIRDEGNEALGALAHRPEGMFLFVLSTFPLISSLFS